MHGIDGGRLDKLRRSLPPTLPKGAGVPQDNAEAVKWFRKAAVQGTAPAQHNLAVMYGAPRGALS